MNIRRALHVKNRYLKVAVIAVLVCFDLLILVYLLPLPNNREENERNARLSAIAAVPGLGTTTPLQQYYRDEAQKEIDALRCPADYKTDSEVIDALTSFFINNKVLHPNAPAEDFVAARVDFYISRGCTSELEKYGYDGVSPITPEVRQAIIEGMAAFAEYYNRQ